MIQHSKFHDGGFVLHKVMVNGSKYSAWFDRLGRLVAAERFSRNDQRTYRVNLERQHKIATRLLQIGQTYIGR